MKNKTIFGVLGTIILGALGSGLWEIIKPGISFVSSAALSIVSFGIDGIANDIYMRVGRANVASVWIRSVSLLLIAFALLMAAVVFLSRARDSSDCQVSRRRNRWKVFLLLIFSSYTLFGALRHSYVASTRSYFDYLSRVGAPYLTSDQRVALDSRLALVKNKNDYDKLVTELKEVIKANNISISEQ